ncbi:methylmalonyl-CoA mutase family protein [Streptomyces sp. 4N509B]|uniref:methylmalonyl-CoA mutase family protein n=1 Tax=Streptomyces sp. 4N509B TaxID=3457413 RepID=UPI003FD4A851
MTVSPHDSSPPDPPPGASSPPPALAAEFPPATREDWHRLVAGVLRKARGLDRAGSAAEEALVTRLEDGVVTRPLYTAADAPTTPTGLPGSAPFVRGGRPEGAAVAGWDVRQRHADPDPRRTNAAVLADLEGGATSLWLAVGAAGGVPVAGLGAALEGVLLDLAPVALEAGPDVGPAAEALLAAFEERGVDAASAAGTLGADPLGWAARTGRAEDVARLTATATILAARCHERHPALRALAVDALPYHEAGGSAAEELGCSLATGVAYLRELTDAGLPLTAALGQLEFRYAATADQFLTIAKLRAARRLWSRVATVSGAPADSPAAGQRQHVVTSRVMMTRRDPWVNMLRTTVACLAAGAGGADAVTVLPFDEAIGLPDAAARRLARNTSLILTAESHLARVIDPAGGSWYVEDLTEQLSRAAWAWFQEIERAGGMAAALASGLVAKRLGITWEQRSRRLATRREAVTGVSEFPELAERTLTREPAPEPPSGGLPRVRRDEAFEALRSRSDAHLAATGSRPRAFLAALGPAAEHTARVAFAAGLLRAGGIEPVHEPTTVDAASAAEALAASGARVACLCGTDARYADEAEPVAAALAGAGARRVALAGRPGEREHALRAAGVSDFVFTGCDAVAFLSSVLDTLGVAR